MNELTVSIAGFQNIRSMSDGLIRDAQATLLPESMCQEDMAYSRKVAVSTCTIDEDRDYSIMLFQLLLSFLGL